MKLLPFSESKPHETPKKKVKLTEPIVKKQKTKKIEVVHAFSIKPKYQRKPTWN